MITKHPTEEELQQFALTSSNTEITIIKHVQLCEQCQTQIANYRLMFSGIKEMEKPVFDFEVAQLVLPQINQRKYSWEKWFFYFVAVAIIGITGVVWYLFGQSITDLFTGLGSLFVFLITMAGVIISVH